jgi:ABC-2 type transport system permease protein
MGPVIALAIKDLRHLIRDRGNAFFALGFPLLVAMFFGVIFGGNTGERGRVVLAVANLDQGTLGKAFVADLAADATLEVVEVEEAAKGEELVRLGKATASVVIPSDYSVKADSVFAGGAMNIDVVVDPSRRSETGLLAGKLNEIGFRQLSRVFTDGPRMSSALGQARKSLSESKDVAPASRAILALMFDSVERVVSSGLGPAGAAGTAAAADQPGTPAASWMPVRVDVRELVTKKTGPRNAYEVSFTQGIIWGLMGCVTAFGASMAAERTRGTLTRLSAAPISRAQILSGKALACFAACMIVQALLILVGMIVFGIRIDNPVLMVVACSAASLGFTGVMMFIAGLSRSEGSGAGMGRALVLVLAMIGGGTIPLFILPKYMVTVSRVSPFSWATTCLEGAMWRGYSVTDMALPASVLLGFGLVGFVIGVSSLRWSE